jgi:hypothetical protein
LGKPDGQRFQTVTPDDLAALTVARALDQAKA